MKSTNRRTMKHWSTFLLVSLGLFTLTPILSQLEGMLTTQAQANDNCQKEYHWLEAECGQILLPGEIQTNGEASENRYLFTPPGSGRYINQEAGPKIATYPYTLDYDCANHHLWARVRYDSFEHNSFWVQFDHSRKFEWRFSDSETGHWRWVRLGTITGLSSGAHELHLFLREEQTQIDKLLITSDLHYTPQDLGDLAENRCDPSSSECDLCDLNINLGDLVVIHNRNTASQPAFIRRGHSTAPAIPAIVIGKQQDRLIVLPHRTPDPAGYPSIHDIAPGDSSGHGYPWESIGLRLVAQSNAHNPVTVHAWDVEQYIDCRGSFRVEWDPLSNFFAGSFRSNQGQTWDLFLGYAPSGVSLGDNANMRLQGLLGHNESSIYYPLISSSKDPAAREGDVVIRDIPSIPSLLAPHTSTYGLGVAECWNIDRAAFSKIVSLTNIIHPITHDDLLSNNPAASGGPGFVDSNIPFVPSITDSETMKCITVHLRPSVLDYTITGAFISYVCTDCGVIQRIDWGNTYQNNLNDRMSDSSYALVFEDTQTCYVLPKDPMYGNWSALEGKPYRLAGFQEYADPNQNGYGHVSIGGSIYQRLGFLAAPVVLLPCVPPTPNYTLTVSSGVGGSVTVPGEGVFQYNANTDVTLQATPDQGYIFDAWHLTFGGVSQARADDSITISMISNGTAQATFQPRSLPNLTDGGVPYRDIHPNNVHRGDTVNVSFRLLNTGSANAADSTGLIKLRYYASIDTNISPSDYFLGDAYSWPLQAQRYQNVTMPVPIPHSLPRGTYYVGWMIDPDNGIQESNEHDNVAYKHGKTLHVQ